MANGDRLFGPNGASGAVTGTGASISVSLDFAPQWVELVNSVGNAILFWYKDMPANSGYVLAGGGGGGGTTGATSGGTPAGTNGSSPVTGNGNAAGQSLTSELSGTGTTAAGQVITTTDSQTCTLNQFRGKWLIQATGATPPNLILSNAAATSAPIAFTVQGVANTDAGSYNVLGNGMSGVTLMASADPQIFIGTPLATHTHTYAGGGGGSFVSSGGVSSGNNGFYIGTDTNINVAGQNIFWNAGR